MENKASDYYIEKVTIGKKPLHNTTIQLVEYQEVWPILFAREQCRIQEALQENALMVEHIGSTSVPGLCAKPIIDIVLVVEDTRNEASYVSALCGIGYQLRIVEPEFEFHHMFKGMDTDVNLHVFSKGSKEIDKYLLFRNYMRKHKEAREQYARTKCALAKRTWKYVQNYADAKSEVVQSILQLAIEEQAKKEAQAS